MAKRTTKKRTKKKAAKKRRKVARRKTPRRKTTRRMSSTEHLAASEILWTAFANPVVSKAKLRKRTRELIGSAAMLLDEAKAQKGKQCRESLKMAYTRAMTARYLAVELLHDEHLEDEVHDVLDPIIEMNPMPGVPGGGIKECIEEMSTRPDVDDPGALCAWIAEQRGEYGWRSLPHIKRGAKKTSKEFRRVMRQASNPYVPKGWDYAGRTADKTGLTLAEASQLSPKMAAEIQAHCATVPGCEPSKVRVRLNPAQEDETAEYAVKRWGLLSFQTLEDRDLTWKQFARRIKSTGDPGAKETAKVISRRTGRVRDFAVKLNPRSKKRSKKKSSQKTRGISVRSLVARALN